MIGLLKRLFRREDVIERVISESNVIAFKRMRKAYFKRRDEDAAEALREEIGFLRNKAMFPDQPGLWGDPAHARWEGMWDPVSSEDAG